MKIFGFEIIIKRTKKIKDERLIASCYNNTKINMTWELLSYEQKIKIAKYALEETETGIMGCCGDIETAMIIDIVDYNSKDNYFLVLTDNNFYEKVQISEKKVIEKWNKML